MEVQLALSSARRVFDLAASRIRPLPDDDQNPLAGSASGDDMIVWLAYREAAAMLGLEASGRPVNEIAAGWTEQPLTPARASEAPMSSKNCRRVSGSVHSAA